MQSLQPPHGTETVHPFHGSKDLAGSLTVTRLGNNERAKQTESIRPRGTHERSCHYSQLPNEKEMFLSFTRVEGRGKAWIDSNADLLHKHRPCPQHLRVFPQGTTRERRHRLRAEG